MTSKIPWATKKVMQQVYELNFWGGQNLDMFYSGEGSHEPSLVQPYIKSIIDFLAGFKSPITLCDLGCGDFNIGKQIVNKVEFYHAIDIVPELIARNKQLFKFDNLKFQTLDISKDQLPQADCVIIRQVFQHLSNNEILDTITKLNTYNYVIITEHIPEGDFRPNIDIISGRGIRLTKKSGVDITKPPFNLKFKRKRVLLSLKSKNFGGIIITTLFEL
ncbi:MAG: class I SAM-dependent methyltransferase [Flavobacteriaceae bacterium]